MTDDLEERKVDVTLETLLPLHWKCPMRKEIWKVVVDWGFHDLGNQEIGPREQLAGNLGQCIATTSQL